MSDVQVLPYGDRACLLAVPAQHVLATDAAIRAAAPPGLVETVPGAASVLAVFATPDDLRAARAVLDGLEPRPLGAAATTRRADEVVEVPVTYDGEDLDDVAAAAGCSVAAVVERHTAPTYVVAFCGFAPGFAYLDGLDAALHLPRRDTPRTRVPAGSVAVAGAHTAVYPSASPGGWHLIGRTDLAMWDLDRDPPALLDPGARVRFRAVRA